MKLFKTGVHRAHLHAKKYIYNKWGYAPTAAMASRIRKYEKTTYHTYSMKFSKEKFSGNFWKNNDFQQYIFKYSLWCWLKYFDKNCFLPKNLFRISL